jgi:hypothetical protein
VICIGKNLAASWSWVHLIIPWFYVQLDQVMKKKKKLFMSCLIENKQVVLFSKLRLTQPSLAGSGAELGKKEWRARGLFVWLVTLHYSPEKFQVSDIFVKWPVN